MKKIFVAITVLTLCASQTAPAFAATVVGNTGNGVDSSNEVTVNKNNSTTVSQSNSATISNDINVSSNTGGNSADRNTGGSVHVSTGDSGVKTSIENMANSNSANVLGCCDTHADTTVLNNGNGDSSDNTAEVNKNNSTSLYQTNAADIANSVNVHSNTGDNTVNRNTGNGSSHFSVDTGNSLVGPISITNAANQNVAKVGGLGSAGGAGDLTVGNVGNGVDTDNSATVNENNSQTALQANAAYVSNWVGIASNTGYNEADRNTGGSVGVDTGDSALAVMLDTKVNSNAAALLDCGCVSLGDTVVKNAGNGDSADSDVTLNKNNASAAYQTNASDVANAGWFDSSTGYNTADRNTDYAGNDPYVETGSAYSNVKAATAANQNLLNSGNVAFYPPTTSGNTGSQGYWWNYGWNWNGNMAY